MNPSQRNTVKHNLTLLTALLLAPLAGADELALDAYNVIWTTPSKNSSGSMPLGNGDIGLNVWVEEGGDLLLYIGKTDSWDENSRLLKLGRLRLHFSNNPFAAGKPFRQVLRTEEGAIEIAAGPDGRELRARLWVDANRPVVRIETESEQAFELETRLELWRKDDRTLNLPGALAWCYRNETSCWTDTMTVQDLAPLIPKFRDPLLGLTSGALVAGDGLEVAGANILRSKAPGKRFVVSAHPLVGQTPSVDDWVARARQQAAATGKTPLDQAWSEHRAWWQAFWARSRIDISGSPEAEKVCQGYHLQRFMTACAGRGRYPIQFAGSIFTVDGTRETGGNRAGVPESYDADFRMWGGAYWFQNTRLLYWHALMAGDFDIMQPFFRFYREALPLAEARTRLYFGHDGAFFPETLTFWGTYLNSNYGIDRSGKTTSRSDVVARVRGETSRGPWQVGEVANTYIRRYWQGGIELLAMMLDYQALTQDERFVGDTLLPLARPILRFYREHYPQRDERGKIVFAPAQSLETWHVAVNPMPEIAGLRWVTDGLLRLPNLSEDDRKAWIELRELLPPLPSRAEFQTKKKYLIPALQYDVQANSENPELYAVFPYRLFGVGKADLEVARETYARRLHKATGCWRQDSIQAALLGLTDDARKFVVTNAGNVAPQARFPGFLYHHFDWIPDVDQGGVIMIALQRMLMQCDGDRILLLPAWPKDWDVSFKLHAPQQTTVECVYRGGKVEMLKVTPESRRKDVEVMTSATATVPATTR